MPGFGQIFSGTTMKCAFAIIGHVCIIMMGAAQFDEHKAQLLKIDKTGVMNMLKAVSENRQIQVVPSYATNEPNDSGFSDESTDYDNEMQETLRNRDGIKSFKTALDDNLWVSLTSLIKLSSPIFPLPLT